MMNIGCHLSSSKGYLHMGQEAVQKCQYLSIFHQEPQGRSGQGDRSQGCGGIFIACR
jgi:hypothetical protein